MERLSERFVYQVGKSLSAASNTDNAPAFSDTPFKRDTRNAQNLRRAGGALHPLIIKINDGFYLFHVVGQTLRNFSGFFHPRQVALVGRGS